MAGMCGRLLSLPRVAIALALLIFAARVPADEFVRVGVLGFRPTAEELQRWQPLMDYLGAQVPGYRFRCEILGYNALEAAIAARTIDFVVTNPGHYVLMTHRNGMSSPLATLVPLEQGKPVSSFGGVIFARADRGDIDRLTDLRGRSIAVTSKGSLGGYQAEAAKLMQVGIRIPDDAGLVETDMPHDRVVDAVLAGRADAGFVRTGIIEAMAREGKLDATRLKVLDAQSVDGFPYQLSTRLYPEWPFAAMPAVDEDLARLVAAALLAMPHGGKLAHAMGIHGFNVPDDYEPVRATLEALRLPPFDVAPEFTLGDIWRKYRVQSVVASALMAVIAMLGIWLATLNRRLAFDQMQLDTKAQQWQGLLTALGDGVYGVGPDGACTFINPAALETLGYAQHEVLGRLTHDLFHPHCEDGSDYPRSQCPVYCTLQDGEVRHAEDWFLRKDGTGIPVAVTATPIGGPNGGKGVVVVFRDISDRRRLETALREEAATDALTRLPNRRYFLAEMERHLARIQRGEGRPAAVLMLDLDEFKRVNDSYGHDIGDEVLKHLATVVREILRRGDLVGRLGGEEFAVLLPEATEEDARQLAERIREQIEQASLEADGRSLRYTTSVGVTLMVPSDHSVRAALQRADAALYRAKGAGRNRVDWEPPPT
ncbi:MAG TPA: diguanylate cyclase [Rhodocyclaceae bacterium]|nr:diguanylate cyclase [Rhodocyclaceae bacterium]